MITKERDELVLNNQGLIYYILNRKFSYDYLDEDDLFSEGCIALLEAADRYEAEKGAFSTLAYLCILRRMRRFVQKEKTKRKYEISRCNSKENQDCTIYDVLESVCDPDVNVEDEAISHVFTESILKILPKQTRLILEEYCEGKMKTQIAKEMDINYYHLVNLCRSAREKILKAMKSD